MNEAYRLSVDECEKLIGHCWDGGTPTFAVLAANRSENYEETAKQCPHCGLRQVRKVETSYHFENP